MAAVGCLERDRGKETTTKDGVQGLDFRRKSGVNRSFCFDDKSKECLSSNGGFMDRLCRLNGSMKTSSFIEPSMPTLRSRGDRRSECMRKRRLSKSEKEDACVTEDKIAGCQLPCVPDLFSRKNGVKSFSDDEMPHVMESVCMPDTTRQDSVATCSSDGSLDASPLTNDGGCSVTPDNSRSCTPSSLNCLLSPISKDSRSADSSQCECKDALPPPVICKWKDCDFEDFEDQGILEHIKSKHVYSQEGKKVSCLWEGCKVYSVQSRSQAWLERHVVCHCGDKPFRCIVDGCSLSFTSHKGLEKHVNNHFKLQQLPNQRPSKSREDTPTKMWKKRRCRKSRPPGVKQVDFFDDGIMEKVQAELTYITDLTQIDLNGSSNSATFHSCVIGRRTDRTGKVQALLHWQPEQVIHDCWVPEKDVEQFQTCTIPLKQLPQPMAANLHTSIYHHHRRRKHRRK